MNKSINQVFKKGSTTYYYSSIFFRPSVREDVTRLYAFVRVIDNYIDKIPSDRDGYFKFKDLYEKRLRNEVVSSGENLHIINEYLSLKEKYSFGDEIVDAFFQAMEMDLSNSLYNSYEELSKYIYGSAQVVGLMMAKILGLPKVSYPYAQKLGEAMQFINMIRDIREDGSLGRKYIPEEDIKKFGVKKISVDDPEISNLIRFEINRYYDIQKQAEEGYKFIPYEYLIPVKTAADIYLHTARKIYDAPLIVFEKKVVPHKITVFLTLLKNIFIALKYKI